MSRVPTQMARLSERLTRAKGNLTALASEGRDDTERLRGKAEGVALALSYLDEESRYRSRSARTLADRVTEGEVPHESDPIFAALFRRAVTMGLIDVSNDQIMLGAGPNYGHLMAQPDERGAVARYMEEVVDG